MLQPPEYLDNGGPEVERPQADFMFLIRTNWQPPRGD